MLSPDPLLRHLSPPQDPAELGRLAGFRVLAMLGRGGMGAVFLAEDVHLRREVAIKVMLPNLASDAHQRERFLREARTAASLEHDHIVPILQVGEERGLLFIVMPLLRGETLETRLSRSADVPPTAETLRLGIDVALALAYAHGRGLIHRDIKPANLWLEQSEGISGSFRRVKLLDFGLARLSASSEPGLTQTGALLGTPGYLAPEQAEGGAVDARADLFSLGCVLYRLTTGELPFPGDTMLLRLAHLATLTPPSPRTRNPRVPAELSETIDRLLEKKPECRLASAAELARRLQSIADRLEVSPGGIDERVSAHAQVPVQASSNDVPHASSLSMSGDDTVQMSGEHRPKRNASYLAWIGGAVVVVMCLVAVSLWMGSPPRPFGPPNKDGAAKGDAKDDPKNAVRPLKWGPKDVENSLGMRFVLVPAGEFEMGSPLGEESREDKESPQHQVKIARPFYLSAFETTQGQYLKMMALNPSYFARGGGGEARLGDVVDTADFPVDSVSWQDAELFCRRLADLADERKHRRTYRLPTEAEWEYACRAGTKTSYSTGAALTIDQAVIAVSTPPGPEKDRMKCRTMRVGSFPPNPFGLYDMHGNVTEWCSDWYADRYPEGPQIDPIGPAAGENRVVRGGNCFGPAHLARSAQRSAFIPTRGMNTIGFRIVMEQAE